LIECSAGQHLIDRKAFASSNEATLNLKHIVFELLTKSMHRFLRPIQPITIHKAINLMAGLIKTWIVKQLVL